MSGQSTKQTSQTQATQTNPWEPSIPYLNMGLNQAGDALNRTGLNPTETSALGGLSGVATNGPYFGQQTSSLASDLFKGGTDRTGYATTGYNDARNSLLPVANQSSDPWSNADFTKTMDLTTQRALDAVRSSYGGAGIPSSAYGDFAKNVGTGVGNAVAPLAWQARNDLVGQSTGAAKDLYSVGGGTAGLLSGLDQNALGNRQAGIDAATAARTEAAAPYMSQLNVQNMQRQMPLQNLSDVLGLLTPIAGLGGQSSGQGWAQTTAQMSPLERAQGYTNIFGKLFPAGL